MALARHDVTPELDVFNEWKIFLVEDDQSGRLVTFAHDEHVKEIDLQAGEVDRVLLATRDALNAVSSAEAEAPSS